MVSVSKTTCVRRTPEVPQLPSSPSHIPHSSYTADSQHTLLLSRDPAQHSPSWEPPGTARIDK
eukprot:1109284-Prorocentrum_minimum.AAC.1